MAASNYGPRLTAIEGDIAAIKEQLQSLTDDDNRLASSIEKQAGFFEKLLNGQAAAFKELLDNQAASFKRSIEEQAKSYDRSLGALGEALKSYTPIERTKWAERALMGMIGMALTELINILHSRL